MDDRTHWERVYGTRAPDAVSWYQRHAGRSLAMIRAVAGSLHDPIIDVGGGASVLVDELLDAGYTDLTVLDLARAALTVAESRLGPRAASVRWLQADVRSVALPRAHYAVWHDRAVFHFLTEPADRDAYVAQVERAVRPGGHVLVATFAEDGPSQCSGLPVARYSPEGLHRAFGSSFDLLSSEREEHVTPAGAHQSFVYCLCRRA
jgi:2-polyprenyl-3-methyl-5-hydroxy-6-metoxy-1,4-benzoquinol methylase